ncbi:MAG TPA: TIGR03013 family XrtA/PEP-CTERM system glycosyltransferase [Bryobacteraceae bacterium]|nr:TIGR03013 family XrtA/PEP-CTERM system glycosyltransferase [Bryobacteraceae bacterium]
MPTSTIKGTTWAEASGPPRRASFKVRTYYLARPGIALVPLEFLLLSVALLQVMLGRAPFEAPLLIALCALLLHSTVLNRLVVSPQGGRLRSDPSIEVVFGFLSVIILFYLFPGLASRLESVVAGTCLAGVLPVTLRPVRHYIGKQKKLMEGVLIVGAGDLALKLSQALDTDAVSLRKDHGDGVKTIPHPLSGRESMVDFQRLSEMVKRDNISRVVVAEENVQKRAQLSSELVDLRLRGIRISDAVDFYEQLFGKIWIEALSSEWFLYTNGFRHSALSIFFKRFVDVAGSLVLLILASPVMALAALAIKLDSPGPVLFRQMRVGLFGVPFVIFKFRSMRADAEALSGAVWASEDDPRITRVGRVLRKFRLDELPQAINVLRGEMSLVGPRPERPCFVDRLTELIPFYNHRHYVKPGITGWAQVKYRYGASVEDTYRKLQYDIYYAKHRSFICDVRVLFNTIGIVLFGKGR